MDTLLGTAWHRLLLEHAPLDHRAAAALVDLVLQGIASEPAARPPRRGGSAKR